MNSWITSEWAKELRRLWNEYDPIGVYHFNSENDWPLDEYDSYQGLIIRHLNNGSDQYVIFEDVKKTVTGRMGLSWNAALEKATATFVSNVLTWFETKKPELELLS